MLVNSKSRRKVVSFSSQNLELLMKCKVARLNNLLRLLHKRDFVMLA